VVKSHKLLVGPLLLPHHRAVIVVGIVISSGPRHIVTHILNPSLPSVDALELRKEEITGVLLVYGASV
jgi:hypothetical protein